MKETNIVWHVTPTKNVSSILKHGLLPSLPEPDGDMAVSFFITKEDAIIETKKWLLKKWGAKQLTIFTVDIKGLEVTQTFPFEVITTNLSPVHPDRILHAESLNV